MSTRLKKKYKKPDELDSVITAKDYYTEFKKASKGLSTEEDVPFFYIPEYKFKPDPKSKEEVDMQPLLWIGEYPSAWQKILKPKVKFACGSLKASEDTEEDGNKLMLTFEDGNGAKPIIAKKVARYVKKAAKVKIGFKFATEETEATEIIEEAKTVSSSTTSPYTRIIQVFKEYQVASLLKKVPILVRLNTLFGEWKEYDGALKAPTQKEKIKKIKEHLEGKINGIVTEINESTAERRKTFLARADSGLKAVNPDVEKLGDIFLKMLLEAESLRTQIHTILDVVNQTRGISNWFSKKMGALKQLSTHLGVQDERIGNKVVEIKEWLKRNNIDTQTSTINESLLTIDVSKIKKLPRNVKAALQEYNKILANGESIESRAGELQSESMTLLEEIAKLDPKENPWVNELKTQIWNAKDELGTYLYDTDNYQKIQKMYETFARGRQKFDDGDETVKGKLKDKLVDIVENLGIEISEWETENIEFSTFEVKERGKHIENIRRIITDFLKEDLLPLFDDKTDIEELLGNAVFLSFASSKPYDDNIRKYVSDSEALLEEVKLAYAKKVSAKMFSERKKFKQSSVQDILEKCNEIQQNIDTWVLQAQRCDLEKAKMAYDEDQVKVNSLSTEIKKYRENTRDIVNLILSFNANEDVVKKLDKEITDLKSKLSEAQTSLSTAPDANAKNKIVMQIAKLRSDLIQKEEQLQAASNLLLEPYKRLGANLQNVKNGLDKDMLSKLDELQSRDVKTEIEGILRDRVSEHKLRYKNIVDAYEAYQKDKANKTNDENKKSCSDILQAIYTGEQAITAEDSFRDKLLEENPNYASLLPEELKNSFKDKLETYKFIRISLDDDLAILINSSSKPLKDELYTTIKTTCDTNKTKTDIEVLYTAKLKVNKLYANWTSLNSIQTQDEHGDPKSITTGDYSTKKGELEGWIGELNDQLKKVGQEGGMHLASLEKVEDPAFEKVLKTTLAKLIEIEQAADIVDFEEKLAFYQGGLRKAKDTPNEKMYTQLVEISQIKVDLAKKFQKRANKFTAAYRKLLTTPTTFAKEVEPVKKLMEIKAKIEEELKRIINRNLTALRDLEGQFFAALGKDFDYYRSTKGGKNNVLSDQKSEVMSLMGIDIINRFNALEATGASKEELRKVVEHIPVSCWPDKVLETLQAWEKVTEMTRDNLSERTEQLTQDNELSAKALMEEKDNLLDNVNDLIALSDNATKFKEKAEEFLGVYFDTMENADKLKQVVLNLMGDDEGLVKKYRSKPERLCQILVAIKNSKEVVESLMGKEKEKEEDDEKSFDDKSFVGQTKEVVDTLSGKTKEDSDSDDTEKEDSDPTTLEKISSTVDSVIENIEGFMDTWMKDDVDSFDKTLAVVTLLNKTGGTIADLVKDGEKAKEYIDFVGVGLEAIGNTKDLLTDEEMSKKDKMVKLLSITGSITGALSTKEDKDKDVTGGLLDGTKAGEVLAVVTNVIKAIEIANTRINDLVGKEKLTREQIEERLAQTPDTIRKIQEDVLGPMKKAVEIVGDVNTVMQLFGAATDLAPGLSIASNIIGLADIIMKMAKTIKERQGHVALHTDTILYANDDSLALSMRQNIKNDNMQLAQQSIDAFAQAVSTAGSIAEVAGPGAPVGMVLKYTGTCIKIGAKVVFAAIDEAMVLHVKALIKRAQKGDRDAKLEIFRDSAYYAKMYVIGLAQDGANGNKQAESLAREYCLGYGISDSTLKEETAELILRQIFQGTGEHDDRVSKIGGGIKALIQMIKKKLTKLSGEELLSTLLDELKGDLKTLSTRLDELEDALKDVDDIVKENKLVEVKMPLRDLRSGLISERTKLEKLDIGGKATKDDVEKIGKIQLLVDMLGKHGI